MSESLSFAFHLSQFKCIKIDQIVQSLSTMVKRNSALQDINDVAVDTIDGPHDINEAICGINSVNDLSKKKLIQLTEPNHIILIYKFIMLYNS